MIRCTLSQSKPINAAALLTLPQAWITRMAKASNIKVNRECFPAQGTAVVLTPHDRQLARGTRARRRVSNCIVSR